MDFKYIVVGVFLHPHKDCEAESIYCRTYQDALVLKSAWKKERKYKDVFIERL